MQLSEWNGRLRVTFTLRSQELLFIIICKNIHNEINIAVSRDDRERGAYQVPRRLLPSVPLLVQAMRVSAISLLFFWNPWITSMKFIENNWKKDDQLIKEIKACIFSSTELTKDCREVGGNLYCLRCHDQVSNQFFHPLVSKASLIFATRGNNYRVQPSYFRWAFPSAEPVIVPSRSESSQRSARTGTLRWDSFALNISEWCFYWAGICESFMKL